MNNDDAAWGELVKTAMLGLQRNGTHPLPPAGSPALSELLRTLKTQAGPRWNAQGLLRAAAALALHRRAGRLPPRKPGLAIACAPDEPLPRCPANAARVLQTILTGSPELLEEWAATAAANQVRVWEVDLPVLLALCKNTPRLRAALAPVLGQRGAWLAQQNPAWQGAVIVFDPVQWEYGSASERREHLESLRASAPDTARQLLEACWPASQPTERAALLSALRTGLSNADESLLEAALHDPAETVRAAAARLLVQLPESRLVQRLTGRALQIVHWKFGLLRGTVEIRPFDPASLLDEDTLYLPTPENLSMPGSSTALVAKIISGVPANRWQALWNKTPAAILQASLPSEWEEALLAGWSESALRSADPTWLQALLDYESRRGATPRFFTLFARLPYALQEQTLLPLFAGQSPSLEHSAPAARMLADCAGPWSATLSQAVLRAIIRNMQRLGSEQWQWQAFLPRIGPRLHPATLDEAISSLSTAQRQYLRHDAYVRELLKLLKLRREMHQAFQTNAPGDPADGTC